MTPATRHEHEQKRPAWAPIKAVFEQEWSGLIYVRTVSDSDTATSVIMRLRDFSEYRECKIYWAPLPH